MPNATHTAHLIDELAAASTPGAHSDWPRPTSLVPIETNVPIDPPPESKPAGKPAHPPQPEADAIGKHGFDGRYTLMLPTREEVELRHGTWANRRRQIREQMATLIFGKNRLARWDSCGAQALLSWHKSGQWVLCQAFFCHDRFCHPCSISRSRRLASNISTLLKGKVARFLTLTLAADQTTLSAQLDRLYRCFKTLRGDEWWEHNVQGGCATLEVTLNPTTKLWHPHLHPVVVGNYLPQAVLSRKWLAITGNSPIVHIKLIPDVDSVARYVAKYAGKGMDDSVFDDPTRLKEWLISSSGRRLCMTFGNWRRHKLLDHTPLDMTEFRPAGSLTHVTQQAALGEKWAINTLNALRKNLRWENLNPDALDDAIPPM